MAQMAAGPAVRDSAAGPVVRDAEASVGQRLLWLLDHYRGRGGAVNAPLAWRIGGRLDDGALLAALEALGARHEALRTTYEVRGRRLFQVVHEPRPLPLAACELAAEPVTEREAEAMRALTMLARREIDASQWPTSAALWRLADEDHLLLLNIHHLATDLVSGALIARDLGRLYERLTGAGDAELPTVEWQYADWSEWQREEFARGRLAVLQAFWKQQLRGAELPRLPREAEGEPMNAAASAAVTLELEPGVLERLQETAHKLRATMYPIMLAAFFAHLHRVTCQRDLAIASLFTNRMKPAVRETVGFFVNMMVLRVQLDPTAPFTDLTRAVRVSTLKAMAHADLPYQMLPAQTIRAAIDGREVRVDDVVFQFLDSPSATGSPRFAPVDVPVASGRFALELLVRANQCMLRFDKRRLDPAWARAFLSGYGQLVAEVARDPQAPLSRALAAG